MAFEKGNEFGKGRPKGSVNSLTKESKEILALALKGEIEKVSGYIQKIKSPKDKIDAISKLLPYFLPRLSNGDLKIETEGEPLPFDYTQLSEKALNEILELMKDE